MAGRFARDAGRRKPERFDVCIASDKAGADINLKGRTADREGELPSVRRAEVDEKALFPLHRMRVRFKKRARLRFDQVASSTE